MNRKLKIAGIRHFWSIAVAGAIAQQTPIMNREPGSGRFGADVAGLGRAVEEEAVIGRNDHVLEAGRLQLVNGHTDVLQRVENDPQGHVRCGFQMAVDGVAA